MDGHGEEGTREPPHPTATGDPTHCCVGGVGGGRVNGGLNGAVLVGFSPLISSLSPARVVAGRCAGSPLFGFTWVGHEATLLILSLGVNFIRTSSPILDLFSPIAHTG